MHFKEEAKVWLTCKLNNKIDENDKFSIFEINNSFKSDIFGIY